MRSRAPSGGYAWCARCGKRVACRLPRAKHEPGDGTVVLPFAHKADGEPCEGRYEPALWRNPSDPSERR